MIGGGIFANAQLFALLISIPLLAFMLGGLYFTNIGTRLRALADNERHDEITVQINVVDDGLGGHGQDKHARHHGS